MFMKTFWKVIGIFVSVFAAIVGAFAFIEKFGKKDYLDCTPEDVEELH